VSFSTGFKVRFVHRTTLKNYRSVPMLSLNHPLLGCSYPLFKATYPQFCQIDLSLKFLDNEFSFRYSKTNGERCSPHQERRKMETLTEVKQIGHAQAVRQMIIDTATRIIETDGQDALSMRSLAKRIDLSPAAIYKYFNGKDEILDAVRQRALKRMGESFAVTERLNGSPIDDVRNACRTLLDFAIEQPALYMLIYERSDEKRPDYKKIFNTFHFRYMQKKLRNARKAGLLNLPNGFTEELLVMQLWTCIHGCVSLSQSLMEGEPIFKQVSDRMLDTMLDNLENPEDQWSVPRGAAE
jgi:AcrR family transcriptional regulator